MTEPMTAGTSRPAQLIAEDAPATPGSLRSLAVTIGPSLVLDGLLALSTTVALSSIARPPNGLFARVLQPVAALGAVAPWIYLLGLRQWVLHWGATDAEVTGNLPGDEIIPDPTWQSTRAIDIKAPVEAVWPWLAQMGQNRGGLYSYDWLENIAGLNFHNADRLVPEWQEVEVGDFVRFAPNQDTLVVARMEPNHCLVWRLLEPGTHQPADLSSGPVSVTATWAFVLRAIDTGHCRLVQRFRFGIRPRALGALYTALIEMPHFVMERRMLLGIRDRAERGWAAARSAGQARIQPYWVVILPARSVQGTTRRGVVSVTARRHAGKRPATHRVQPLRGAISMTPSPIKPPVSGSLDGLGAGDHDVRYVFGRLPRAVAPFPFSTREFARLMVVRSRLNDTVARPGSQRA